MAGLLGALSVTGRLLLTGVQRRIRLATAAGGVFTIQACAAAGLILVGGSRTGTILTVIGFGCGFGVASLATPQLLACSPLPPSTPRPVGDRGSGRDDVPVLGAEHGGREAGQRDPREPMPTAPRPA